MSNNRATIYRPLSIDGTEISSNVRYRHSLRPQILAISLCLLCMIIPALLITKELFHLSIPNLLRTIFGTGSGRPGSSSSVCISNEFMNSSSRIDVMSLDLNYTASSFTKALTKNVKDHEILSSGFYWDHNDAETTKFRPQGVTTYHEPTNGGRFVLVSWYGRKDEGYSNRGGRISFVNISDMNMHDQNDETTTPSSPSSTEYFYTHVLLVDMNGCTLDNIHVGGIEQRNGTLYVADSRKGQQKILEFDIGSDLYQLPVDSNMFGYRYVLRQSSSFHSPTTPSFISYDIDLDKFVIGTYARCGKKVGTHVDTEKCFTQPKNRVVWYDKHENNVNQTNSSDTISNETESCHWHYFSEMQGAVSASVGNGTIIWISSSYGPIADSHLHVVNASSSFIEECPQIVDIALDEIPIFQYPPGLEDLHIEQTSNARLMWMITEFGTRRVFATQLDDLLP